MNDHAIDALPARTEVAPAAIHPYRPDILQGAAAAAAPASATTLAERTADAWLLLRQLQGHHPRCGDGLPGSDHVDEITVDWLHRVVSPEDRSWLAESFDHRALGWPTMSLLESLLKSRSCKE